MDDETRQTALSELDTVLMEEASLHRMLEEKIKTHIDNATEYQLVMKWIAVLRVFGQFDGISMLMKSQDAQIAFIHTNAELRSLKDQMIALVQKLQESQ